MENRKKMTLIIIVVVLMISVGFGLAAYFFAPKNQATPGTTTNNYLENGTSASSKKTSSGESASESISSESTSSSSPNVPTEANQDQELAKFLESYVSYDLSQDSLNQRQTTLSNLMTSDGFSAANIQSDTDMLKSMVKNYADTKQVNTSSPVPMVSRKYSKSTIYKNVNDTNSYYVELFYNEKPMDTDAYPMKQTLYISMSSGKVDKLTTIDTRVNQTQQ